MEYGVVLRWWLFYQVLLVAGVPLAARLLPDAPDRGASVAMPLSLVVVTVATLWVGQIAFGQLVVVGVFLAFLALSAWLARGGVAVDRRRFAEVVAVFTVAFAFLVTIRAAADGVHPYGGEKFLDFGLLQSLLRADRLPPQDMWFAGESVVYYYGGHLMSAIGAHLTGSEGRFAYSPALAGFYAMAVTAAYGLASTVAAERDGGEGGVRASTALGVAAVVFLATILLVDAPWHLLVVPAGLTAVVVTRSRRVRAGVLAAFLYGFASNLMTPVRLLAAEFGVVREAVVAGGISPNRTPTITPERFDRWHASRVIEYGINEFPLFAYMNGDLHAHMMSVSVLFCVVAVGLAYYRTPDGRRWRRRALLFGAAPLFAGTLLAVNTWSFPTALGVLALSVALADAPPWTVLPARTRDPFERLRAVPSEARRVLSAVAVAAAVAVLGVVVAWPFVWNVLLVGAGGRNPSALPHTTQVGAFLIVHGLFLVAFAAYLLSRAARNEYDWLAAALAALAAVIVAASFDLVVAGVRLDTVAVLLAGPLVPAAWLLRRRSRVGYEAVLVAAGAGLVVLVEYVYLADGASGGRFNTVFKVYAQVWALWSVAGGVALAALAARRPTAGRLRSVGGTTLVVVLVVAASVYGAFAVTGHVSRMDDASLDAMEHVHDERPGEAAAVEWLNDKPDQPHIVSAPGVNPYSWQNPASSLTGIPTVAGWIHEIGYRGEDVYWTRVRDVEILFTTEEARSRAVLLRKHDVEYVWVGPVERDRYDLAVMRDEPGISVAYATPAVSVYAVNQTALTETRNA